VVSLAETDAVLMRETALTGLVVDGDRVVGATAESGGSELRIRANRGVLLAAGGFERGDAMRHAYQDPLGADWTLGAPGNTGSALRAAVEADADTALLEQCWWAPGLMLPNGTTAFRLFERGKPGSILVNGAGLRFANET
jgi:3-oxosteroid 1-dehydrogenase